MFDIGWTELLVIAVVLIVVVGPKDLPPMLRAFGKMTQRARKVAGEFRAQFDEALREAELDDVRQTISDAQKLNPVNSLREAMNPLRQMGNEIKADLQRTSTASDNKTEVPPAAMSTPTPSMSLPETPPLVSRRSPPPQPSRPMRLPPSQRLHASRASRLRTRPALPLPRPRKTRLPKSGNERRLPESPQRRRSLHRRRRRTRYER